MTNRQEIPRRLRLALAALALVGMPSSSNSSGPAQARPAEPEPAAPPAQASAVPPPASRIAELQLPRRSGGDAPVEDLFAERSWYVAPPPPPPPPPAPPPPPPTAPPLPFTFMGSYAQDGEPVVYFLMSADRVYNVKVGDTVDDTYSIDAVGDGSMSITYKPLNVQQTLAVGGGS